MRGADQAWIPARATVPVRAALLLRFRPLPEPLLSHSLPVGSGGTVGIQMVSCDSVHMVPVTGRVRVSRTFVGEPGSPASLRHLSHGLGGPSGIAAEAGLARIISFRQEPPPGPV